MLSIWKYRLSELLPVYLSLLMANISAFLLVIWLLPQFVFFVFILWLLVAFVLLGFLHRQNMLKKFLDRFKQNAILLPFLIYSGLSVLWSLYWQISLLRWSILIITVLSGGYIGLLYGLQGTIKHLSVFGIYVLLLSTVLVFLAPSIGVMNYYTIEGAWKGLYWHKNHMGLIASFINLLFLYNMVNSLQSDVKNSILRGFLYFYSLFFIIQTDSAAAYLVTIILHGEVFLAVIFLKFKKILRRSHYVAGTLILVIASLIIGINVQQFLAFFNRNTTLTGRIPMWNYLFETYVNRKPLLGYGFNAFWYIEPHRVDMQRAAGYPDPIVIADNGFLDLIVNTGYIGLILFLIFYLGLWGYSIKGLGKAYDLEGVFPAILMSYTLLANVSWSLIFENEGFFMLIMVAVLFCVSEDKIAIRNNQVNNKPVTSHVSTA